MKVDKQSPVPITHQLERLIREQIAAGELEVGQQLPTELEFCERLGVSRTPVRKALGHLVASGMLVRYPGRGTFVASNRTRNPSANEVEEVTITVPEEKWCWPFQRAAAAWNQENPERQVRIRFQVVAPVNLRYRLTLAVAQGSAADLSVLDSVWIADFAERGYLEPMRNIDPVQTNELIADLVPSMIPHHSFNGDVVAYPAEADFMVLWYRKDWFAREDLRPPRTWDEWLACLRHFQSADVRHRYHLGTHPLAFAGGMQSGETTTFQLLPILWSAGADVIDNHEVILNSEKARSALRFIADLVRRYHVASKDVVNVAWNNPGLAFAAGSVAMALGGTYEGDLIREAAGWNKDQFLANASFVPVPAGPDGEPATLMGGLSYGIYRQSRRKELALSLLARAMRPETHSDWCSRMTRNPATISGTQALDAQTEPFLHATSQLFKHARTRWPIPEYVRVSAALGRMFESVILGETEPDEAVARAAVVISGITGLPERGAPRRTWTQVPTESRFG